MEEKRMVEIIINEANSLLHRKSKELSKSIIKTPKDLERFAVGLDKLSQDMWDYKNELEAKNDYSTGR
ncbi:hypothetical protein [Listeria seeligeri]|uniref:hypothetical protein n=1 Tax=Listeria seeligeri TaxID=1640 RepID=UPI0022EBF329|nr:hypothetical protein [Listeria seeligeri]